MVKDIKISDETVERLKKWIIIKENYNIKTRDKSDSEMVKLIKKRIEEEANAVTID